MNRVPRERLGDRPVCATCRHGLLGPPVALDGASFEKFVGRCELPVVVDFWAPWCGPCRTMAPWFAAAADELVTEARLAKLDTQEHGAVAARFHVQGIPTLILFDRGAEASRISGAMPTQEIVSWVRTAVEQLG